MKRKEALKSLESEKKNRKESLRRIIEFLKDEKCFFQSISNFEEVDQYIWDFKLAIKVLEKERDKT